MNDDLTNGDAKQNHHVVYKAMPNLEFNLAILDPVWEQEQMVEDEHADNFIYYFEINLGWQHVWPVGGVPDYVQNVTEYQELNLQNSKVVEQGRQRGRRMLF